MSEEEEDEGDADLEQHGLVELDALAAAASCADAADAAQWVSRKVRKKLVTTTFALFSVNLCGQEVAGPGIQLKSYHSTYFPGLAINIPGGLVPGEGSDWRCLVQRSEIARIEFDSEAHEEDGESGAGEAVPGLSWVRLLLMRPPQKRQRAAVQTKNKVTMRMVKRGDFCGCSASAWVLMKMATGDAGQLRHLLELERHRSGFVVPECVPTGAGSFAAAGARLTFESLEPQRRALETRERDKRSNALLPIARRATSGGMDEGLSRAYATMYAWKEYRGQVSAYRAGRRRRSPGGFVLRCSCCEAELMFAPTGLDERGLVERDGVGMVYLGGAPHYICHQDAVRLRGEIERLGLPPGLRTKMLNALPTADMAEQAHESARM